MPVSITDETTAGWKAELATILSETTDPEAREALGALTSALEPYFGDPKRFATILGKIAKNTINGKQESELMSTQFGSIEEIQERLPEGVSVTAI